MKTIISLLLLICISNTIHAQNEDSYEDLVAQCQLQYGEDGEINLAWWIPVEFWIETFKREESMSITDSEEIISALEPYTIFAIVEGDLGIFGDVTYKSYESYDKEIQLFDKQGQSYTPQNVDDLEVTVQVMLSTFKPILKGMMGPLGENMHFFVFKDFNNNERIADPFADGNLKMKVRDEDLSWRLPIGALLPRKACDVDGETFTGTWNYCPYHGTKLK